MCGLLPSEGEVLKTDSMEKKKAIPDFFFLWVYWHGKCEKANVTLILKKSMKED